MDERRSSTRHGHAVDIDVRRGEEIMAGASVDVSAGGMRLSVEGELSSGEQVGLKFELPGLDAPIEVEAVVRWVDRIDPHICGVQFREGLRAKEVWAINRLIGA